MVLGIPSSQFVLEHILSGGHGFQHIRGCSMWLGVCVRSVVGLGLLVVCVGVGLCVCFWIVCCWNDCVWVVWCVSVLL